MAVDAPDESWRRCEVITSMCLQRLSVPPDFTFDEEDEYEERVLNFRKVRVVIL